MDVFTRVLLSTTTNKTFNKIQQGAQKNSNGISPKTIQKYLQLLVEKKLLSVSKVGKRNYYEITEKGLEYLRIELELNLKLMEEINLTAKRQQLFEQ